MSLGLVIPVWNDQEALNRLLDQVRQMSLFDEIVVVDDGSDIPVEVDAALGLPVQVIRHDHARGPGVARNAGLAELTSEYVLFFDSDDLLTEELPRLWKELQGETFDFCIFRHCDSRQSRQGRWRQMPYDDAFWRQAGMGGRALRDLPEAARPILARTANYPWNKIFTTFVENAIIKARHAAKITGLPAIADDSGLDVLTTTVVTLAWVAFSVFVC